MTNEIIQLLQAGDTYAAIQYVHQEGSPREIAKRFGEIVGELYWKAKDLPAVIAVARGGIHYCLGKMREATEADDVGFFGSQAKMLAFNLGSYVWPGWDEPRISPGSV
jgi:hypothetical protein